jgi:hypothetical protein
MFAGFDSHRLPSSSYINPVSLSLGAVIYAVSSALFSLTSSAMLLFSPLTIISKSSNLTAISSGAVFPPYIPNDGVNSRLPVTLDINNLTVCADGLYLSSCAPAGVSVKLISTVPSLSGLIYSVLFPAPSSTEPEALRE